LEPVRPIASHDLAAGVAFELEVPTDAVVATDRQEPAADPPGVRQGVPDVVDRSLIGPPQAERTGVLLGAAAGADLALDGLDFSDDVDHWVSSFSLVAVDASRRSRRPRASSVSSASIRCSQTPGSGSATRPAPGR